MIDRAKNPESKPAADSGTQQVAAVYAKALLGATEKAGTSASILAEFDTLVELLAGEPQFEAILHSQLIGDDKRQGVIDRVFAGRFSPLIVDFLRVLSRRGRLDLLRVIHVELGKQYDVLRRIVRAHVTTAVPLDAATAEQLKQTLRPLVAGEPFIETAVDPDLIGGAVVRIGDTVYDGSVAKQLEQLRSQIFNRSVHEIQSRRDRFRYPGGN